MAAQRHPGDGHTLLSLVANAALLVDRPAGTTVQHWAAEWAHSAVLLDPSGLDGVRQTRVTPALDAMGASNPRVWAVVPDQERADELVALLAKGGAVPDGAVFPMGGLVLVVGGALQEPVSRARR